DSPHLYGRRVPSACSSCLLPSSPTILRSPSPPLFPYTTLFRSPCWPTCCAPRTACRKPPTNTAAFSPGTPRPAWPGGGWPTSRRSEEHTSELQSRFDLVCRLLLEKKKQASYQVSPCARPLRPVG